MMFLAIGLFALMAALIGCPLAEEEAAVIQEEDETIIDLYNDGYMNSSCENPAWSSEPMNGWIRCESFVVIEEIREDGSSLYQLNLDNCSTSIFGDGWTCEARLFQHTFIQH